MLERIKKFVDEYVYGFDMGDIVALTWILMFAGFLIFINSIPTNAKEVETIETSYGQAWEVEVTYYTGVEEGEWFGSHDELLEYGMCAYTPSSYGKYVVLFAVSCKGSNIILNSFEIRDTGSSRFFSDEKGEDRTARLDIWFETEDDAKAKFKSWADIMKVDIEDLKIYMVVVDDLHKKNLISANKRLGRSALFELAMKSTQ